MTDDTDPRVDGPDSRADAAAPERVADLEREYEQAGQPFARLTVVRREPPVSANVGDRAIVTPDGDLVGWIGGAACAQSVAVKEAQAALESGEPRLVGLAPDPDDVDRPGLQSYPMTCHSGGTLELFVEPVTPTPRLAIVGDSPIARALRRLAVDLTYEVRAVTDGADPDGADETVHPEDTAAVEAALSDADYAVVASMGEYDDTGLAAALAGAPEYVGLVASDRRRDELADQVADSLALDAEAVIEAVTTPAGLDVGAKTPEEIAVSVLAELVAVRRDAGDVAVDIGDADEISVDTDSAGHEHDHRDHGGDTDDETVVDPVCGMDVVPEEAAATVEHDGQTVHFCGEGCAEAFADAPEEYLGAVTDG
ncbi:YHS domain-containing protein [Halovenus sp. WSH3]|uniref:YHS domain-containing protein n=1 Tax=Halovenus carboxidivorans TaxID=2692199 RepID=A0A6B0T420_9EURY|nr:XdhC family protein [Halovenus carboxidivorans]MXR52825.1 YHS domain-containing protein [Halovenus carboxidivorans]